MMIVTEPSWLASRAVSQWTNRAIVAAPETQLVEAFVRRDGQWWIEADHNLDTKPATARPGK